MNKKMIILLAIGLTHAQVHNAMNEEERIDPLTKQPKPSTSIEAYKKQQAEYANAAVYKLETSHKQIMKQPISPEARQAITNHIIDAVKAYSPLLDDKRLPNTKSDISAMVTIADKTLDDKLNTIANILETENEKQISEAEAVAKKEASQTKEKQIAVAGKILVKNRASYNSEEAINMQRITERILTDTDADIKPLTRSEIQETTQQLEADKKFLTTLKNNLNAYTEWIQKKIDINDQVQQFEREMSTYFRNIYEGKPGSNNYTIRLHINKVLNNAQENQEEALSYANTFISALEQRIATTERILALDQQRIGTPKKSFLERLNPFSKK